MNLMKIKGFNPLTPGRKGWRREVKKEKGRKDAR